MAGNINEWLNKILTARYGEEVRGSIYNSIKLFNDIVNETSSQFNQDAAAVAAAVTTAQTAATSANTAKTAAETAKTAAEAAKAGAEKAKNDTSQYTDIAGGYAQTALNAKTAAENARDATIEAKNTGVAELLNQTVTSMQEVIDTGNEVKAAVAAQQAASIQAVKDQETTSKTAVQTQQTASIAAVESAKTEALTEVGTAKEEALKDIGDAADDIISDGGALYVKKTGDTITGVITAPQPLENAADGQLATVGFVKNNTPKDAVTKEGTSVVIGDIQVPDPETESSVVPKNYADGNGYTQAMHDGFQSKFNENTYKNNIITSGYNFRMNTGSTETNNKYALVGILHVANGGMTTVLHISGGMGDYGNADIIDIYVETSRNNFARAINVSPRFWVDKKVNLKIFMVNPTETTSDFYIYIQKQTYQWVAAQLFLQPLTRLNILEAPENTYVGKDDQWTDTPVGELVYDWSTDTNEYKDYANSVPYQYAKAAGFPSSEAEFKKSLEQTPVIIADNLSNTHTGYVLLAHSTATISAANASGVLIIEGEIHPYDGTDSFKIVINNKPTDNQVLFEGYGLYSKPNKLANIVLVKNSGNKYEVYFEKLASDYAYQAVRLNIYNGADQIQWVIDVTSPTLTLTSGTIPGTKVWDLKTAWGSTSRTQITKEEIQAGTTINGVQTLNEIQLLPSITIPGLNPSSNTFLLTGTSKTDITGRVWYRAEQADTTKLPRLNVLAAIKTGETWGNAQNVEIVGIADTTTNSGVVNYKTLKSYVAANAGGFTPANNAGAHNSIFRGKSLGATITSAQLTAIKNGTFDDLYIGDYWTSSNVNYRIAEFDYKPDSKHNIVLIPDQPLMSASYFPGGKKNTDSWTKNMCANFTPPNIPTSLVANTNVKSFEVMQGQNWRPLTGEFAYVEWVNKKAWYPSEQQVFGNEVYSHFHGIESALFLTAQEGYAYETDSQFALFRLNPNLIASTNGNPYWLCDTYPVKNTGNYHTYGIKVNYGTRLCEQIYDAADNLTSSVTAYLRPYYVIEPV